MVDALNTWGDPLPVRKATDPVVRIVLAEAAGSPGPLHYILESEGFQILGSASDDDDLTRILSQGIEPDVIVVDAAVPATTAMTAQEFSPTSELIVVWPEGIVPPGSADQVFPELVFEDLGPAVRRAAERNRLRHPIEDEPDEVADVTRIEPDGLDISSLAAARTAGRVLVGTVAVIASIVLTMGASFALQGFRAAHDAASLRSPSVVMSLSPSTHAQPNAPGGSSHASSHTSKPSQRGCDANRRNGPNTHASTKADGHAATCPAQAGGQGSGQRRGGSGSGSGQGQGADHGQSGEHGSGSGSGNQGSHTPSDHPTGPPESPGPGDHANPTAAAGH